MYEIVVESSLATRRHTISGPDEILVLIVSVSCKYSDEPVHMYTVLTEPSTLTYTKYGNKVRSD